MSIDVVAEKLQEAELRRIMGGDPSAEVEPLRSHPEKLKWRLMSKSVVDSDLSAHLSFVSQRVPAGWAAELRSREEDAEAWISIFFEGWGGGGPILSTDDLRLLESHDVPVLVDFYYMEPE